MLIERVLRFDGPADATIGAFFRDDRRWGSRDRELIGDVVHGVLRRWSTMRAAAAGDAPVKVEAIRLALLAWPQQQLDRLDLSPETAAWLAAVRTRHRAAIEGPEGHDLPAWLATSLRAQEGEGFDALAASLLEPAPLDLRVNTLRASRDDVQRTLSQAGIEKVGGRTLSGAKACSWSLTYLMRPHPPP